MTRPTRNLIVPTQRRVEEEHPSQCRSIIRHGVLGRGAVANGKSEILLIEAQSVGAGMIGEVDVDVRERLGRKVRFAGLRNVDTGGARKRREERKRYVQYKP